MDNIFKLRESGVYKEEQIDPKTAFTYYEVNAGDEYRHIDLPLNYIIFILSGSISINCNEFEDRLFAQGEMVFMLRTSSVHVRVLKKSKVYVLYFDTLLSSSDHQFYKAFHPEVEKSSYDFKPVLIPGEISVFLKNILFLQQKKVDCANFNKLKHCEFFLLLRYFCPREELLTFLSPLISGSLSFRTKVLEKYSQMKSGRVTELADLVGMGRKNFDKHFRDEFGLSPAKWLLEEKSKHLRQYLKDPDVTISDAMDRYGFNSPSHFNRFCHKYFKTSPGSLIKNVDGGKKSNI